MKGLLLKDYHLIKSVLCIMLAAFMVVGVGLTFLTSTWVLTVLATVMLGMISVTTINMDKNSGWNKVSTVLPVPKSAIMDCKYILYLLLSGAGLLLGVILGILISLLKGQLDHQFMLIFISISATVALFSGSMTIPFAFLFSEEKSMLGLILAYPVSAAVFAGATFLIENILIACGLVTGIGLLLYVISWITARNFIVKRDMI